MAVSHVAAVILAAGGATRFGSPKQLALFRGEPLVLRAVRNASEAGASPIVVVVGAHADLVSPVVEQLDDVTVVVNRHWQSGIASSLRAGIESIPRLSKAPIDGVLLLTVDQPLVDDAIITALLAAFSDEQTVVAAEYGSVVGIPALIGIAHIRDLLLAIAGDRGASGWLRANSNLVTRVPFEAGALDADTVEQLQAIESVSLR